MGNSSINNCICNWLCFSNIWVSIFATCYLRCKSRISTNPHFFSFNRTSQNNFNKVLLANAATSALRLHQRIPSFAFNREFLNRLIMEDSCHYLLFSLIFFYVSPVFLIVCPVVLFAVLHASSYSLKLLDVSIDGDLPLLKYFFMVF